MNRHCGRTGVLFEGGPGGDKRPGLRRGLYNQGADAEPADYAVAAREICRQWSDSWRKFRYQSAVFRDLVSEITVACRINAIETRPGYRQRAAACLNCALMSRSVDTGSQSAGYSEAEGCQMRGEFTGHCPASMSGVPAAYDGKLCLRQIIRVAAHE